MTDAHVHLERGSYTPAWAEEFAASAKNAGITELCLLEHSYLFPKFLPLYDDLRRASPFIDRWLSRKGGTRSLDDYLRLTETARSMDFGLSVRFGLYTAMKRHGVRICTASDAHCPADTGKGVREFYESGKI